MGNETSVQYREDDDKRTKSGRVLRTSSLKATQRPNYPSLQQHQKNAQSTATTTGPKKRGIGLKRASTFTSISTFSRPLFQSKLTSTSNDKQTASKFSFKKTSKCKEVTKQQKNLDVTNQIKGELSEESHCIDREDELFIPRREQLDSIDTSSLSSSAIIEDEESENTQQSEQKKMLLEKNLRHVSVANHISLEVNKPGDENKLNKKLTMVDERQNNQRHSTLFISSANNQNEKNVTETCCCARSEQDNNSSKTSSQEDDLHSIRSSIYEETFDEKMETYYTPETSECEDEIRRASPTITNSSISSSERRRKNVLRSQSMNYHMTRPKLSLTQQRSSSIDDCIVTIDSTKDDSDLTNRGLGGRRSSDSSLLKEQHVKRSEQFSALLKQYREQRENKTKLSSYGLGVIAENSAKEEKVTNSTKLRRKNDYIDSWLKDQSERINTLSDAIKGDPEKIRSLRASFRERPLKTAQKELLPQRASSVKLARRKPALNSFISSSDSDDLDETNATQMKLVDKNGNFISKKQTKNPLKKQLTETLLLVDKSFKNANTSDPWARHTPNKTSNNTIRFCSTPTSAVISNGTASNIAVVKPIPRTETVQDKCKDNVMQVYSLQRLEQGPCVKKFLPNPEYKDPLGEKLSDKELIKREEDEARALFPYSVTANAKEYGHIATPPRDRHQRITRSSSDSVSRISESLNKVMGDLKTLRNQDVTLAKQLISLGRSISDFKNDRRFSGTFCSDSEL
jgi:hypothetical protein